MDRIKQILGKYETKQSVNVNNYIKIGLESKQRLLPPDHIDYVVSAYDVFNSERQNSYIYRILGTINPTATNALFNLNDSNSVNTWSVFNTLNFLDLNYPKTNSATITYAQSISEYLFENNGWFGYTSPNFTNSITDMEPQRQRFMFISDINPYNSSQNQQPIDNWKLTITYPFDIDNQHYLVNNGLLIIDKQSVSVSNRTMVAIGTPCMHNLNIGDTVNISGLTNSFSIETYQVVRTGLDDGSLMNYYFVIDLDPSTVYLTPNTRMKKNIGGVESEYYFRKFKKVATTQSPSIIDGDYELCKVAFSENIYTDTISQFSFNSDINVEGLTDNLGRPLSELYLTIVKTDSNGLFGNITSGIELPFMSILNTSNTGNSYLLNVPVINKIHNGTNIPFTSHIPLEHQITIANNEFYGDLVEYNLNIFAETTLATIAHRFNTVNRESNQITGSITLGPRQEGYYYKPHNLIKIREFSNYINFGTLAQDIIPSYAVDIETGLTYLEASSTNTYIWRDLLDIGVNDGSDILLDYPFVNGCHYMSNVYNFNVLRQDPFNNWNLFWSNFPMDPIGDSITNNYNVNSATNVC